jgi:hypothetical protein
MVRSPQPETVCDYELHVISGQDSKSIVQVEGNYQRKRIHRLDPLTVDGIRLVINATNGESSARIYEVRIYA